MKGCLHSFPQFHLSTCPLYSLPSQDIQPIQHEMKSFHSPHQPSLSASTPAVEQEMGMLLIPKVHCGIPGLEEAHSFIYHSLHVYLIGHNLTEVTLFPMTILPSPHFGESFFFYIHSALL